MISVILPVYRVEKYIDACIRSVLGQNYRDFEVILVDDGSPDASAQMAEALLEADGTIAYQIIHTENRGVSAARNTGLDRANGEYVIMVDSDDVLSPDFLQTFADMMQQKPGLDIYSCGFSVVGEHNWLTFDPCADPDQLLSWEDAQTVFFDRKLKFLLPTLLLSREFMQANTIRFDEAVRYSEDVQFIWRCLACNRKLVCHSGKKLYNYILHPGSTMTASGIEKILTCCEGLSRLMAQAETLFCPYVREQLVMRTYFSMLHSAAKMMDFKSFRELYTRAECAPHIKAQAKYGSAAVRIVSGVMLMSRFLGYWIMRKY